MESMGEVSKNPVEYFFIIKTNIIKNRSLSIETPKRVYLAPGVPIHWGKSQKRVVPTKQYGSIKSIGYICHAKTVI